MQDDTASPNRITDGQRRPSGDITASPTAVPNIGDINGAQTAIPDTSDITSRPKRRRKLIAKLKKLSQKTQATSKLGAFARKALKRLIPKSSLKSSSSTGGFSLKSIFRPGRPRVAISFIETTSAGEDITVSTSTKIYSTYDEIRGKVTVVAKSDCPIDDLEIALTGTAKTFVDKLSNSAAVTGRSEAIHKFLKLIQPVLDNELPPGKLLLAGKSYTWPFRFVVPSRLMPKACIHPVVSPLIRDLHLMLPPSLADKGSNDGAGEQSKISYKIHAKVLRVKKGKNVPISSVFERIRIRPANDEMPPLNVDGDDTYCLRSEKTIRDGLLKSKNGTLTVETSQPKSFMLRPGQMDSEAESSFVHLLLRFDPETDTAIPPKLNFVSTKLKVTTHFATTCRKDLPKKLILDLTSDVLSQIHDLSKFNIASVDWNQHTPNDTNRHGSVVSFRRDSTTNFFSSSNASAISSDQDYQLKPSSTYRDGAIYYTARVAIPVSLPASSNKQFVPTFHSCLIARTYLLHLSLSLSGSSLAMPLKLIVPVQVSAVPSAAGAERLRLAELSEQAMIEAAQAHEPRYIGPGQQSSNETNGDGVNRTHVASELPPGYEAPGYSRTGQQQPHAAIIESPEPPEFHLGRGAGPLGPLPGSLL